jgi:hypothetical protein
VDRRLATAATLFEEPSEARPIMALAAGEPFELLDDSLGWAWGYAGAERRVGYVPSDSLSA